MKKRVADIVIETLVEEGIDTCFCVVGGGAMHLNNALSLNTNIKTIFNHHEQACSMAADAYARINGGIASVCVTSGPGGTNAITGVLGAWQDNLPMIIISGQARYNTTVVESGLKLRYRGNQENDIVSCVRSITKYAELLINPLDVKRKIQYAVRLAMNGRRGPVWLDIPLDVQSAQIEEEDSYSINDLFNTSGFSPLESIKCNIDDINELKNKISEAKRPVILAGTGIVSSGNLYSFRQFIKKFKIPVIDACLAIDELYSDYDLYYGVCGTIGPRVGNYILQNSDFILSIGCSLGFKVTGWAQEKFAPKATIYAVEIDEMEMLKPGLRITKVIKSDLKCFFDSFKDVREVSAPDDWIEYCDRLKKRFSPFEPGESVKEDDSVCSYRFWKIYEEEEPSDNITVMGNNTACSAKIQIGIKQEGQRCISNSNCGSMGYDLPATIGAAVASGKRVNCVTGDGSIMMNLQELQTINYNNLPIGIVVFSNDGYNAIRQTNKSFFGGRFFGCSSDTGISFPEFKKIAEAFGYEYIACRTNSEIRKSLRNFFATNKRVILEVFERFDDPISPKVMSRVRSDGGFETPALEDMAPFIDQAEHESYMLD